MIVIFDLVNGTLKCFFFVHPIIVLLIEYN